VTAHVEVAHTFTATTHEKIVYPLVLLRDGDKNPAAKKLFEFLRSAEAQKIFEQRGFKSLK